MLQPCKTQSKNIPNKDSAKRNKHGKPQKDLPDRTITRTNTLEDPNHLRSLEDQNQQGCNHIDDRYGKHQPYDDDRIDVL